MRVRTWTVLVALLGALLHAGALVRHHGIMLGTHLLEQALAADPTLCRGGEDGAPFNPGLPKPTKTQSGCPVCAGQAPTSALVAPDCLTAPLRLAAPARWIEPGHADPALRHAVCPPPRGPPALAA